MPDRKLNVFICHAKEDKPTVRELYRKLAAFEYDLEKNLVEIEQELKEETYLPGGYHSFEIGKLLGGWLKTLPES